MKRRHRAVYNRDTKIQLALVVLNTVERKAIVIDHLKNIGFIEDGNGDMRLSVGVFNSTPTKYSRIKKLIAGNFTASDSEIIDRAIIGVSMKSPTKPTEPQHQHQVDEKNNLDPTTTAEQLDLERELACYNNAVDNANQIVEKIDNLISAGVPRDYIDTRYPDVKEKLQDFEYLVGKVKVELADAVGKKTAIKAKLYKLTTQLKKAEYDEYIKQEELIAMLKNFTEKLAFDDAVNQMIEDDLAELNRLKRINELEQELTTLKSESKLFSASAPSTPVPVAEKPPKPTELEVQLPTEEQDKEIRFLANHLYQVRRGNEEHNPTICRRIAALSEKLKMTKAEFCKKILSISVQCWDDRHKEYFTALGLYLHGERRPRPTDTDSKKKDSSDYKGTIKKWADTHIIAAAGNDILNSDVYEKFIVDTGCSDIAKISFYNILARSLGYTHKCKYRRDAHGKTCCDTYYAGYRLV